MGEKKYQHYVPQTYLSKWLDDNNQIHLYNKEGNLIKSCKTKKVMGINDLYTKNTDYLIVCTCAEKEKIFKCLDGYEVYYKNEKLKSIDDFSNNYHDFNEWIIKDECGNRRSEKVFRNSIEQVRVLTIEDSLGNVEDRWNDIYNSILKLIDNIDYMDEFITSKMDELERFIFIQDWRTIDKKTLYKELISVLVGYLEKENNDIFNEMVNEFSTCYFMKTIENFINKVPNNMLDSNFEKFRMAHMKIFLATGNTKFLTNDKPILYVENNKLKNGIYYPISPTMVCGFFKGDSTKISIEQMPVNSAREINKIIKKDANEFYISSVKMR